MEKISWFFAQIIIYVRMLLLIPLNIIFLPFTIIEHISNHANKMSDREYNEKYELKYWDTKKKMVQGDLTVKMLGFLQKNLPASGYGHEGLIPKYFDYKDAIIKLLTTIFHYLFCDIEASKQYYKNTFKKYFIEQAWSVEQLDEQFVLDRDTLIKLFAKNSNTDILSISNTLKANGIYNISEEKKKIYLENSWKNENVVISNRKHLAERRNA